MTDDFSDFEQRKRDHIALALDPIHQTESENGFDAFRFQHEAIPDINFTDIEIKTQSLGGMRQSPFFISSMTAGHFDAAKINAHLLAACEQTGWAMGVGSQRRELSDAKAGLEWKNLRKTYPNVFLMANLGLAQLVHTPILNIQKLIDNLQASAFIVHCNPLQECIQPEGTTNFKGSWQALEHLVRELHVPVVVKETGSGFSKLTMQRLNGIGVHAIDVSGMGGTHWGRIEGSRAKNDWIREQASITFKNWGISTALILFQAQQMILSSEIWGSGGIRHGLDAAKALVLGASMVGIAKPILKAALEGPDSVLQVMRHYEYDLKVAMFCTGVGSIQALKQQKLEVTRGLL